MFRHYDSPPPTPHPPAVGYRGRRNWDPFWREPRADKIFFWILTWTEADINAWSFAQRQKLPGVLYYKPRVGQKMALHASTAAWILPFLPSYLNSFFFQILSPKLRPNHVIIMIRPRFNCVFLLLFQFCQYPQNFVLEESLVFGLFCFSF